MGKANGGLNELLKSTYMDIHSDFVNRNTLKNTTAGGVNAPFSRTGPVQFSVQYMEHDSQWLAHSVNDGMFMK